MSDSRQKEETAMLNKHNTLNYSEAAHTDAATKVAEDAVAYALPPQVDVQQNTIEAIMLMYSTLTEKSKQEVVAQLTTPTTCTINIREYAQRICTKEEYDELEIEGFLNNPLPVVSPEDEKALLAELQEYDDSGYLSDEETRAFFKRLAI